MCFKTVVLELAYTYETVYEVIEVYIYSRYIK